MENTQMIIPYNQLKLRPEEERMRKKIGNLTRLIDSLKNNGQIHDLIVDEKWYVRIGTRRYLAMGEAQIKQVKIDQRKGLSEEQWTILEAEENLIRKDYSSVEKVIELAKAKEAYEKIYPETKQRANIDTRNKNGKFKSPKRQIVGTVEKTEPYTKYIARKRGVSVRTVEREVELGQAIREGQIKNEIMEQLEKKEISSYKAMRNLKEQNSKLNSHLIKLCKPCAKAEVRYCIYCNQKFIICRKSGNLPFKEIDAKACKNSEEP